MNQAIKRILIVAICILLQLGFTLTILIGFSENSVIIHTIFELLSTIIFLGIIRNSKSINSKIPWLILILISPIFGGLLYCILGRNLHKSKILKLINASIEKSQKYLKQDEQIMKKLKQDNKRVYGQVKYILENAAYPISQNNEVKYFDVGEKAYKVMLEELSKAKKFIFLEYFIIENGEMWQGILDILEDKVKQGVDVRVIYDDAGSVATLKNNYDKYLEKKGIKCICFNKLKAVLAVVMNNRDHRKIMVIDGNVAFSGGINIADEYINKKEKHGHWKDNGIMIKGQATWNFTIMFLEIWNAYREEKEDYNKYKPTILPNVEGGYICPYGESPLDNEILGENIYLNIINQAKDYVYIFTPYLIIDSEMVTALTLASKRGVDVRIIMPGIPDKKVAFSLAKSYYEMLIKDGVKIYQYTPGFVHSKVFVCDDEIATVGTINLDYRSLYLHFECGVYIYKDKIIEEIKKDVIDTFEKSHLVELEECNVGLFKAIYQAILRLFAPLL